MIQRQLSLLIALAVLAVLAAPVVATPQAEKAAGPTTITLWTGYSERLPVYKAAAADYSKEHPNVTIEIANFDLRQSEQKLQIALSSGTAPDLSGLGFQLMQRLSSQDYLDTLPSKHVSWLKDSYEQAYLDAVTRDGKIYGIPEVQGFQLLFYNLDDYDAAGLTKPAGTLDELMANARKLTKYDANGKVTHSGISLRLSGRRQRRRGEVGHLPVRLRRAGHAAYRGATRGRPATTTTPGTTRSTSTSTPCTSPRSTASTSSTTKRRSSAASPRSSTARPTSSAA